MCGACGTVTVPDPVLGAVRTLRQHIIVADAVNAVCRTVPGSPRVTALGDGWLLRCTTGATRLCPTVDRLWSAIIETSFRTAAGRMKLREAQRTYLADADAVALVARVIDVGQRLAGAGITE